MRVRPSGAVAHKGPIAWKVLRRGDTGGAVADAQLGDGDTEVPTDTEHKDLISDPGGHAVRLRALLDGRAVIVASGTAACVAPLERRGRRATAVQGQA